MWILFAGGLWVCVSGLVGPWACAGVVDLQGRLAALSAVLTRGVDGRAPAPSLRGTAGIWCQLWSRQGPRKGSLQVCPWRRSPSPAAGLPGELGKVLPAAGLAHGTPRHLHQESYPKPQRRHCYPPPPRSAHLHPHSRLVSSWQGPGTLSLSASIARRVSRAPDWTCSQVNLLSRTREMSGRKHGVR